MSNTDPKAPVASNQSLVDLGIAQLPSWSSYSAEFHGEGTQLDSGENCIASARVSDLRFWPALSFSDLPENLAFKL
jgi:hypothetical protein